MSRVILNKGDRFGRLTVLKISSQPRKWDCICDCGNYKSVAYSHLRTGFVISCGCYNREKSTTHGKSKTKMYYVWRSIRNRCNPAHSKKYPRYAGRGIKVCEEWFSSYEKFEIDMGDSYFPGATIDRIDNNKDYSKNNCKWSTPRENTNNRSTTIFLTIGGETKPLAIWSEISGVNYSTILGRIKIGLIEHFLIAPGRVKSKSLC